MNEQNKTQEIFNKIINLNNNKASETPVKPIKTEVKTPIKNDSIYDTIIDTIIQEPKGESENGK